MKNKLTMLNILHSFGSQRNMVALLACLLVASCATVPKSTEKADIYSVDYDKILATNPDTLTLEQFYQYETAIISGFSGSGGNFLGEPEIAWLRAAEKSFNARGVTLKDEENRNFVIANSYLNDEQYEKAFYEFKRAGLQEGAELAEWFINNKGVYDGPLKVVEYAGSIPCGSSETARAENERYLFVAYFKGAIYRYDKLTQKHAIIYAPENKYDWCDKLRFNGETLVIQLRDEAGTHVFNNQTNEIAPKLISRMSPGEIQRLKILPKDKVPGTGKGTEIFGVPGILPAGKTYTTKDE